MISASREVNGSNAKLGFSSSRGADGGFVANQYARVRYNGNAFGGFHMTDSEFPRKSNLNDRKQAVLRIAAENFEMVKRLARVQSSVGR